VPHCDQAPISSPFRDIAPQIPVRTHRHTHTHTLQSDFIFCPMQGIALDRQKGTSARNNFHYKNKPQFTTSFQFTYFTAQLLVLSTDGNSYVGSHMLKG